VITIPSPSVLDGIVEEYQQYLAGVAGLQASTCRKWAFIARLFLKAHLHPTAPKSQLQQLTPEVLLNFLLCQAQHYAPASSQSLAAGLRSFCRFLCVRGYQARDLSAALPSIANHPAQEELPRYLSRAELRRALAGLDRRTLAGQRDYAMVLCLARLGLRAGEVAGLRLEDVDWRGARLWLQAAKGRRPRSLPLSAEVGGAIAAYLRRIRPAGPMRALFRSLVTGRALSADGVSLRAGLALARAGVGLPGKRAHQLRHTIATHLVQQGASLKAVADLLGHRNLRTTQIYAKVNLPLLRAVAQPWPKEVAS
jgi:integrase